MSLSSDCNLNSVFPAHRANQNIKPESAYIHIPFCRRRCYYCDFPISVVGDRPPLARRDRTAVEGWATIDQYLDLLCQEILTAPADNVPLQTIFFGGGTPSLLTVRQLERILAAIAQRFAIATDAEISIEMDPGTFDLDRLRGYRSLGVNRVSLGVQSFQAELLAACGRTHTPEDIQAAIAILHQIDLPNFSIDLISGLPQQTLEHWEATLHAALDVDPPHISVYDLTVEPGTAFGRWYQPGEAPLPFDDMTAQMYRLTRSVLTSQGYDHYEISNYARPGYQCRHNRVYWENRPYYGFGMAAASYVNSQRFTRPRKRREYAEWVQDLVAAQGQLDYPNVTETDRLLDTLMLGLRLSDGLQVARLVEQFGDRVVEQILAILQPYQQCGWVEIVAAEPPEHNASGTSLANSKGDRYLRLTDPEGFLFSNVVLTSLFEQFSA